LSERSERISGAQRSVICRSPLYLIFGHYSITCAWVTMSDQRNTPLLRVDLAGVKHYAKVLSYPCGLIDIVASTSPDFGGRGWEAAENWAQPGKLQPRAEHERKSTDPQGEDRERSMRRARAKLRRLALANDFRWFVTLTLDPSKVDSCDGAAVVKKLNAWCSNAVQRHGLRYILVPERHKKGGIHFHGFFSDSLEAVDSGTMKPPGGGKPRKPKSAAQRAEWLAAGGQIVYNLPGWSLGFTTAMELYGEYPAAVAYVCKYIGKDGEKPAGRWYYSGGDLREAEVTYADISPAQLVEEYGNKVWKTAVPGREIAVMNGVRVREQVQKEGLDV